MLYVFTRSNVSGYPDTGHGKFAEKLTMDEWIEFNNTQRVHYNFLEGLPVVLLLLLVSGLHHTRFTVLCGSVYFIGRALYTIGYLTKGHKGRMIGVLTLDIALIALLYGSFAACLHIGNGFDGLYQLIKS